jgi:hypothetical protein
MAFLLTQDEIGLNPVSAVFGLAFGGLIPGYILAVARYSRRRGLLGHSGGDVRRRSAWRQVVGCGAIHDAFGFYISGIHRRHAFNVVNLLLIGG